MIFRSFVHKRLGITDRMVFAVTPQQLVAAKGIGVVNRTLAGVGLDVAHQFLLRDRFYDLGVDPASPL